MPRQSHIKPEECDEPLEEAQLAFEKLDDLLGYRRRRAQDVLHREYVAAVAGVDLTA